MNAAPNYWEMSDEDLATAYSELTDGMVATEETLETLMFMEDAILQRIGAPDTASTEESTWLLAVQQFEVAHSKSVAPA